MRENYGVETRVPQPLMWVRTSRRYRELITLYYTFISKHQRLHLLPKIHLKSIPYDTHSLANRLLTKVDCISGNVTPQGYTVEMPDGLILQLISQYRYAYLVPGALFIGPLVSLTAGALIRLGTLELWATASILMITELLGDVFWYWVGHRWGESFVQTFGRFVGISSLRVLIAKHLYHTHHDKIIIISKLTAGFGFAPVIYFTAGLSRIPFRRYIVINIIGQVIWTSTMLGIGYYLGYFYLQVSDTLHKMFFVTAIFVVFVFIFGFGQYLWQKFAGDVRSSQL